MTDLAEALICIYILLSSGCCVFVCLEMKFAFEQFELRCRVLHFLCCLSEAVQEWLWWSENCPKGFV